MVLEWTDESYFALEGIENFSLFNYRLKSLQQMNHDDWLADAIAGREDFLQINDLADAEKLTTATDFGDPLPKPDPSGTGYTTGRTDLPGKSIQAEQGDAGAVAVSILRCTQR